MTGKTVEVDLSGPFPLVRCDGEIMEGVTRAEIVLEAHELARLELHLTVFDVTGGSLPKGWRTGQHNPGERDG
jgi:hypothetical protein